MDGARDYRLVVVKACGSYRAANSRMTDLIKITCALTEDMQWTSIARLRQMFWRSRAIFFMKPRPTVYSFRSIDRIGNKM